MESVDLIASGYEWNCPKCDELNHEMEISLKVTCAVCKMIFETGEIEHAHSK